jgi:hypothetical protein
MAYKKPMSNARIPSSKVAHLVNPHWINFIIYCKHGSQYMYKNQGRGVHVTGVSAAYTFKLNKNILSE